MFSYAITPAARKEIHSTYIKIFKPDPEQLMKKSGFIAWNRVFSSGYFDMWFARMEIEVRYASNEEIEKINREYARALAFYTPSRGLIYINLTNILKKMEKCKLSPELQLVYLKSHELVHAIDFHGPFGKLAANIIEAISRRVRSMKVISIGQTMESEELSRLTFLRTFAEARAARFVQILADQNQIPMELLSQWAMPLNKEKKLPSFNGIGIADYALLIKNLQMEKGEGVWRELEPNEEEISNPALFQARISGLYNDFRNSNSLLDNVIPFRPRGHSYVDRSMG